MALETIQALLDEAVRQHQAGALDRAAPLYQQVLERDPGNADALHLLGMIALANGQAAAAAELTRRAIALRGQEASYHFSLGLALQTLGDMPNAVTSYRNALLLHPNNPDSYNNMGNALATLGRFADAENALRHALALQPGNAVARNNLANVQLRLGRIDDAAKSYEKAIAQQPDYVGAVINLGNLWRQAGQTRKAETLYRRAVAMAPANAGAHCSLGLVLWDMGRCDDAAACYRAALALDPDHAESLANLGIARWDGGALDEAESLLLQAVRLQPRRTDLLNNLAALFLARGNAAGALDTIHRSLMVEETPKAKRLFCELMRSSDFTGSADEVCAMMVRALSEPWDRPGRLGRASAKLIKAQPMTGPLVERANAAWPQRLGAAELLGAGGFAALAGDALLMALLTSAPNSDIALERFLTMTRGAMARAALAMDMPDAGAAEAFAAALAQQCFINDYIFVAQDDELIPVLAVRDALAAGQAVTPMQLLVLAAYLPLHTMAGAETLLGRSWSAPVEQVLTQQLREPRTEQRLRAEIPRLTKINDAVSQLVQGQYEENPYPRWVRLAAGTPANIAGFIHAKFPLAAFARDPGRDLRDILIAGCGTGQQSISAALRFQGCDLLAVDISLSSLCYARRKSDELGLTTQYGQADILELASLGRQFDMIECLGVLHHMADPFQGWRVLLDQLRPGGFMLVGLYSETARQAITAARARIAELGLGLDATADNVRNFRQLLLSNDSPPLDPAIAKSEDFFSVSACRDLLFHVQERRLTIPQIAGFLAAQNLRFLGFDLGDAILNAYRGRFADDMAATNLANWDMLEAENPGLFAEMYVFWIQKPVCALDPADA